MYLQKPESKIILFVYFPRKPRFPVISWGLLCVAFVYTRMIEQKRIAGQAKNEKKLKKMKKFFIKFRTLCI